MILDIIVGSLLPAPGPRHSINMALLEKANSSKLDALPTPSRRSRPPLGQAYGLHADIRIFIWTYGGKPVSCRWLVATNTGHIWAQARRLPLVEVRDLLRQRRWTETRLSVWESRWCVFDLAKYSHCFWGLNQISPWLLEFREDKPQDFLELVSQGFGSEAGCNSTPKNWMPDKMIHTWTIKGHKRIILPKHLPVVPQPWHFPKAKALVAGKLPHDPRAPPVLPGGWCCNEAPSGAAPIRRSDPVEGSPWTRGTSRPFRRDVFRKLPGKF